MATRDAQTRRSTPARGRGRPVTSRATARAAAPPARRAYDSSRRQAEAAERQAHVLEVAARRFAADGWTNTTVADVATEAGVSPELIFRKIGGKGGLLVGALEQRASAPSADLRAALKTLGLENERRLDARIGGLVTYLVGAMDTTARLMSALQSAADQDPEAQAALKEQQQRRRGTARQLVGLLSAGKVKTRPELADELYVLTSPETYLQYTRDCGWSRKRYAEWLETALRDALARHGVTR